MKFYIKLVIFIVILFIIILLLRKKIPILKEKFDNFPSPSEFDNLHNHLNSKEVDDELMNVIILTFYFKDTCPKSREFLYGCCEDFENDEINEMNEKGYYLEKNKGDTDDGKHDSYLNRIFNWFKEEIPNKKIVCSGDYISVPNTDSKCLSLKNFKEKDNFNNKCKLEKRPTYYYLELFANLFNKNFNDDLINGIISSHKTTIELDDKDIAPELNSIRTNSGIKYNINEASEIIDDDPNKNQKSFEFKDINFQLRLQVKEATLDEDVGSLQIEIPRYRTSNDMALIREGKNPEDNVEKTSHKFLGNLNNFKEIMEFINDYLNISIQNELEINKYFLKDEQRLMKNVEEQFVYAFKTKLNTDMKYQLKFDTEYSLTCLIKDKDKDKKFQITNDNQLVININETNKELEEIKLKIYEGKTLNLAEQKIYDNRIEEVTIKLTFVKNTKIPEESYFKLFEINPEYHIINFFSNDLIELEEGYKKQLLIPITSQVDYLGQTDYKDYLAYLYNENKKTFNEYEDLENYFEKFRPNVVSYDFDKNSRNEDVNIRYIGDKENYVVARPRIRWNNIVDFPNEKKEYMALIMSDKYLEEYYQGDKDKRPLIYWIIWNIPKSDGELSEIGEDNIRFVNQNGDLFDEVRSYSEIYKYRMINTDKIQFYFDEKDRLKKRNVYGDDLNLENYLENLNKDIISEDDFKDYLENLCMGAPGPAPGPDPGPAPAKSNYMCAMNDNTNIRLNKNCYDDYDNLGEDEKNNCRIEFSRKKKNILIQDIKNSPTPTQFDIDYHEKRTITYKFEVFNYNKATAKDLDKIYNDNINNLDVLYDKLLIGLENSKINYTRDQDMNVEYKIKDTEDLDDYLDNNDFEVKGTYPTNIKEKHLTLFSYKMKYYEFKEKEFLNIRLEKNTYWVLYFKLENKENKDKYVYINNDKITLNETELEFRVPYQTDKISIYSESSGSLCIKQSRVPTYRLDWIKVLEEYPNTFNELTNENQIEMKKNFDAKIKLNKSIGKGKEVLKYKLNFYKKGNVNILNNLEDTTDYERNKVYDSIDNTIHFSLEQNAILEFGTITPVEKNNNLLELEEIDLTLVKANRISTIELDTLSCDVNDLSTIQPVPTLKIKGNLEGDIKMNQIFDSRDINLNEMNLAIRIYEKDKMKPSYLEWGIPIENGNIEKIINYEMFKYKRGLSVQLSEEEIKYSTHKTKNYYLESNNSICQKIVKLEWTENVTIKKLPLTGEDMVFNYVDNSNIFKSEEKYELIFNNMKEKWQLWEKQIENVYTWIGEQKNSDYLLLSKSRWVFAPKYKSFCEGAQMEPYDPRKYPTWYDRHKEFRIEDVFEIEIEISNDKDNTSIYDCNININNKLDDCGPTPSPEEDISYNHNKDLKFTNTLFNLGELETDNTLFDFFNMDAYINKDFRVEIIPYLINQNVEENSIAFDLSFNEDRVTSVLNDDDTEKYNEYMTHEYLLSEKVKQKYINPNLIIEIKKIISNFSKEIRFEKFKDITDSLLIHRGNLDVILMIISEDEITKIEEEVHKLKLLFHSMDETSDIPNNLKNNYYTKYENTNFNLANRINDLQPVYPNNPELFRDPVIYTTNNTIEKNINFKRTMKDEKEISEEEDVIPKIFDDMIKKKKYLYKNYTSYGDLDLYQNETHLKYRIPIVKKGELCPVYRQFEVVIRENASDELINKMNLIRILVYSNMIIKMYEKLKVSIDSDKVYSTNFENTPFSESFFNEFKPSEINTNQNQIDYLEDLVKQIEKKIDIDLLKYKHILVLTDKKEEIKYLYNLDKDILYNLNNNVIDDNTKKEKLISQINQNFKSETDNISLARDIYIQYTYLKKINEYVKKNLSYLSEIGKFNNSPSPSSSDDDTVDLVNELLSKTESMYIFANQKYLNYHPNETQISRSEGFGSEFTDYMKKVSSEMKFFDPPKTYTDTIEDSLNQYKSMVFKFLDPK